MLSRTTRPSSSPETCSGLRTTIVSNWNEGIEAMEAMGLGSPPKQENSGTTAKNKERPRIARILQRKHGKHKGWSKWIRPVFHDKLRSVLTPGAATEFFVELRKSRLLLSCFAFFVSSWQRSVGILKHRLVLIVEVAESLHDVGVVGYDALRL